MMARSILASLACFMAFSLATGAAEAAAPEGESKGAAVSYQLPTDGPLPRTYNVTLAITDARNPDWILSTFRAAAPRTVTAENGGKFTEYWNGLDDNHMPLPPGRYGVKGIYLPTMQWKVDGQPHAVVPKYRLRLGDLSPSPEQDDRRPWETGDPVDSPLGDIAAAPDGRGVFYWRYLENSFNNIQVDLRKPINYDQATAHFGSGGAAGGESTATDGQYIWSYCEEGGQKFIYRADGPWGKQAGRYRKNVIVPDGRVVSMDALRLGDRTYVYVAQRGKMTDTERDHINRTVYREDRNQPVNRIETFHGSDASTLGQISLETPIAIKARGEHLFALHEAGGQRRVVRVPLKTGVPNGEWELVFNVPVNIKPADFEVDPGGRFWLADRSANKVYQLDARGQVVVAIGRLDRQQSGKYDPLTLMAPDKLTSWRDEQGQDRLLILEDDGPNRISEWSADGKLLRSWNPIQTTSNHGYAIDPTDTSALYIQGHGEWLVRYTIDWDTGKHEVTGVWPEIAAQPFHDRQAYPKIYVVSGRKYLTFGRNPVIYRFDGDQILPSAGFVTEREPRSPKVARFVFRDANGNGKVDDDEYKPYPFTAPKGTFRYWGDQWFDDLSYVAIADGSADLWRISPTRFDEHGNPVFEAGGWQKLITDPIYQARAENKATALFGGNELDDRFTSSWAMPIRDHDGTLYVGARGGKNASANFGGQYKLTRYDRTVDGGYRIRWRTGRIPLDAVAEPGEVYGSIFLTPPTNGILGIVDQSRAGYLLYTDDGLYVDTLLVDIKRVPKEQAGMYMNGGEFFAGMHFVDQKTGKIYLAMGKETPIIYELAGWSRDRSPVNRLTTLSKHVDLASDQVAPPPAAAIALRGGRSGSMLASFTPTTGLPPAMDGSATGWADAGAVKFGPGGADQGVDVQLMYNADNLYLRFHARTGSKFQPVDVEPADRIFVHGRGADTVSFYLQGDPQAATGDRNGRPGDARYVFAVVKDGDRVRPMALGLFTRWDDAASAKPMTYRSPVGQVSFAHVAELADAELGYQVDKDGKGFVVVARLPRSVLPIKGTLNDLRTRANFDATFGGHNRFWWSNADGSANKETYDEPSEAGLYPGAWSQAHFQPLGTGLVVPRWQVIGPWGGLDYGDLGPNKDRAAKMMNEAVYPPDRGEIDFAKVYKGPETTLAGKPGSIRWQSVALEPETNFADFGKNGSVHHAVTWIYMPADAELDCAFITPSPMNHVTLTVNGKSVKLVNAPKGETKKKLAFKKGWNRVDYRGFAVGYVLRFGLRIDAPESMLWQIGFSATPPEPGK